MFINYNIRSLLWVLVITICINSSCDTSEYTPDEMNSEVELYLLVGDLVRDSVYVDSITYPALNIRTYLTFNLLIKNWFSVNLKESGFFWDYSMNSDSEFNSYKQQHINTPDNYFNVYPIFNSHGEFLYYDTTYYYPRLSRCFASIPIWDTTEVLNVRGYTIFNDSIIRYSKLMTLYNPID